MSDTVISVENLSKCYRLGAIGGATLRADVSRWLAKLRGKADPNLKIGQEHQARLEGQEFWALQDVSFEVKKGEILGVIGRNGAGKSTLLKILSRVTAPTSGRVSVKGRIASLLEVGTGFHPELTGRENIFLNGAILGMTKAEIRGKFDEIVDFSGVEEFIDTPVKRYSSGMYVRLAFAVAAHLEPEILIVDEVLAVGDAEFQKKCLGKMQDVAGHGRTVLFVSHNMTSIARLCGRGVLLHAGKKAFDGKIAEVISTYNQKCFQAKSEIIWSRPENAPGDDLVRFRAVRLRSQENSRINGAVDISDAFVIELEYELLNLTKSRLPIPAIHVINENGVTLFASADFEKSQLDLVKLQNNMAIARCQIPGGLLAEGRFTVLAALVSYNPNIVHGIVYDAVSFQAVEFKKNGIRGDCAQEWPGVLRPKLIWS